VTETRSVGDDGSERPGHPSQLAAGFGVLVFVTWILIVLGALVRANEAGLACPDWPLCFGELVPRMDVRVAFEWSHRLLAGSISLLFAGLAVAAWREPRVSRSTRRLLAFAAALLGVQILLGALTVWELLASWTVTSHLLTGNAFAASVALVAWSLRPQRPTAPMPATLRPLLLVSALLLFVQMALGGLVSSQYAGLACPEWPTCNGGVWFPTWGGGVGLHLLHRVNGYATTLALTAVAWSARGAPHVRALATTACALVWLQLAVGVANVLYALPVEVTGLHSAIASALVLTLAVTIREAWRRDA
jgi:cytochrome c oxidase assembly protein subunit 15